MKLNFYFVFIILFTEKHINCIDKECFEVSCEKCDTEEYGSCTKCRKNFKLIDGKCPCQESSCALCSTGLAGYNLCIQCKNGYFNYDNNCYCPIENCFQCSENGCLLCNTNYHYNSENNKCEKNIEEIKCFDSNCKTCFSGEEGACEECLEGYDNKRGICYELPKPTNKICPEKHYFLKQGIETCQKKCSGIDCSKRYYNNYLCDINKCLICVQNQLKIFSNCNNFEDCIIEGCLNCIYPDECVICAQGYYLINGICKKCIEGCSLCSNNQTCDYCFSGYELNNDKQCIFNENNFDFNIDLFNYYKKRIYEYNFPKEKHNVLIKNDSNIKLCDKNCLKCYDNSGVCLECDKLYKLVDNKCIQDCSIENCLECRLLGIYEVCLKCKEGYITSFNKDNCALKCSDIKCMNCSIKDGDEYCNECIPGYKFDKSKKICVKNNKILYVYIIIVVFIGSIILIIIIIGFIMKCKKRNASVNYPNIAYIINNNQNNHHLNTNSINIRRNRIDSSGRTRFNTEDLKDEFEVQKRKTEKGLQVCQFCKKKFGKFLCDCGCIVCKEHSILKKIKEKNEEKKICFVCKKVVKNVNPIQKVCNICFQVNNSVAHFKCGCSIEVCKDCYIKCKMNSDKCPGCRKII